MDGKGIMDSNSLLQKRLEVKRLWRKQLQMTSKNGLLLRVQQIIDEKARTLNVKTRKSALHSRRVQHLKWYKNQMAIQEKEWIDKNRTTEKNTEILQNTPTETGFANITVGVPTTTDTEIQRISNNETRKENTVLMQEGVSVASSFSNTVVCTQTINDSKTIDDRILIKNIRNIHPVESGLAKIIVSVPTTTVEETKHICNPEAKKGNTDLMQDVPVDSGLQTNDTKTRILLQKIRNMCYKPNVTSGINYSENKPKTNQQQKYNHEKNKNNHITTDKCYGSDTNTQKHNVDQEKVQDFNKTADNAMKTRTKEQAPKRGVELDRVKRRLIRSVARLLVQEKKPEEEVWAELKKETGCDCELLWLRMRALTLKKLRRHLEFNDCVALIPKPARMSLTDWLLFDLVLVHQDIDLIDMDNTKEDRKPLVDLFELVYKFNLETQIGVDLARSWSDATLYYNNQGHQCSPMLLQRRWYQLKETTRNQFYSFWYAYRGTAKRIALAEPHTPSPLQAAIARKYKHLVICPFVEWEELIKKQFVILPDEFQRIMILKSKEHNTIQKEVKKLPDDNAPDLEVIEPVIETIDLRLESDSEMEKEDGMHITPVQHEVKIKEEPPDMDIAETIVEEPRKSIYDKVLESTVIDNETMDSIIAEETHPLDKGLAMEGNEVIDESVAIEENEIVDEDEVIRENNIEDVAIQENEIVDEGVAIQENDFVDEDMAIEENEIVDEDVVIQENNFVGEDMAIEENETVDEDVAIQENNFVDEDLAIEENEIEETIQNTLIVSSPQEPVLPQIVNVVGNIDESNADICEINDLSPQLINTNKKTEGRQTIDELKSSLCVEMINQIKLPIPINIRSSEGSKDANECILDKEDGEVTENAKIDIKTDKELHLNAEIFEISDVEDTVKLKDTTSEVEIKPTVEDFSFGELSNDINFVDDGIAFVDDGIVYLDEDTEVDDGKSDTDKNKNEEDKGAPAIDEKLLMYPTVYVLKLDDMGLTQPFDHVSGEQLLNIISAKSQPAKKMQIDSDNSDDEDDSENVIPDTQRVKVSSYLLQKPRCRTYTPIQLCKNPDFNTRLKRLTVGFFSSPRNRVLLKHCKPLTVDLSKAFELNLVDGTLYLKGRHQNIESENIDDSENRQNVSVVPSAMPVQSLIDNSKISDILHVVHRQGVFTKPGVEACSTNERNKTINLPDISEIRRINQRLLTAEVTPIQVQNNMPQVPVSIVTSPNTVINTSQKKIPTKEVNKEMSASVSNCPPKVVDITEDFPGENNVEKNSISDKWNRHGNLVETNRQGRLVKRFVNGVRVWPKAAPMPWKPRQAAAIPWLSRNMDVSTTIKATEDTLLTLDSLNKMLYLLFMDKDNIADIHLKPAKAKYRKKKNKFYKEFSDAQCSTVSEVDNNDTDQNKKPQKSCKPKIIVKSGNNTTDRNNTDSNVDNPKGNNTQGQSNKVMKSKEKNKNRKQVQIKYCCWAREKMLQMLFSRKRIGNHDCKHPDCKCCCRSLLQQYLDNDRILKNAEKENTNILLSEISNNCIDCTDETTPTVVPCTTVAVNSIASPIVTPIAKPTATSTVTSISISTENPIESSNTGENQTTTNIDESVPIVIDDLTTESDCVPALGSEVSVTTTTGAPGITVKVNIAYTPGKCCATPDSRKEQNPQEFPMPRTSSATANVTAPNIRIRKFTPPGLAQITPRKPPGVPSVTTITPLKSLKEKMLFLNSKQLSEKPSDNPIFLGKNKILLTTVKFPPNLKYFELAKNSLKPTLNLPKGVQLLLLPDGTVTYTVDPQVDVNPADLAAIPALVTVVQQQLNANMNMCNQNAFNKTPIVQNEIVNLTDDDDDISENSNVVPNVTRTKNDDDDVTANKTDDVANLNENDNEADNSTGKKGDDLSNVSDTKKNDDGVTANKSDDIANLNEDGKATENKSENTPNFTETKNDDVTENKTNDVPNPNDNTNDGDLNIDENEIATNDANLKVDKLENVSTLTVEESKNAHPEIVEVQTTNEDKTKDNYSKPRDNIQTEENNAKLNNENITETHSEQIHNNIVNLNTENIVKDNMQELNVIDIPTIPIVQEQLETSDQNSNNQDSKESDIEPSGGSKSKNILSELMEMSGIFDEDMIPQESLPLEAVHQKSVLEHPPLVPPSTPIAEPPSNQPCFSETHQLNVTSESLQSKAVNDNNYLFDNLPATLNSPIGELSAITSLYELKYACTNNGSFFKLDFDTGFLIPINVCMKQKPVPQIPKFIAPKSVIDLTDDDESTNSKTTSSPPRSLLLVNNEPGGPSKTDASKIKPVKLFKSLHPGISHKMHNTNQVNKTSNIPNNIVTLLEKHKRKQILKQSILRSEHVLDDAHNGSQVVKQYFRRIRPKIGLDKNVSSNYTVNEQPAEKTLSSEPEKETEKQYATNVSDDSSDEEPLAKKAKRKREVEGAPSTPMELEVELQEESTERTVDESTLPEIHYELVLDQSDGEDGENCILGV